MLNELLAKAQQGDKDAMRKIGNHYCYDAGNPQKGVEWWEKAAALSDAFAMFNLGLHYRGQGNFEMAKHWLEKAYQNGDPDGAVDLGVIYYGRGNLQQAVFWWEKVADAAPNAARNLVFTYADKNFHGRNKEDFLKWLKVSANKHNDPWGKGVLGVLYCGIEHHLWKEAGFSGLPQENREEGVRFIKEGVATAENGKSDVSFQLTDYTAFAQAMCSFGGKTDFSRCTRDDLGKAIQYDEKALALAEELAKLNPVGAMFVQTCQDSLGTKKKAYVALYG